MVSKDKDGPVYAVNAAEYADLTGHTGGQERALSLAVDAARRATLGGRVGVRVYLPTGVYRLSSIWTVPSLADLDIVGDGRGTVLFYDGVEGSGPAIDLVQCNGVTVRDLQIVAGYGKHFPMAVRLRNCGPGEEGNWPSSSNVFRNVHVGRFGGTFEYAFFVHATANGGVEGNNEAHEWHRCYAAGYKTAGWYVWGPNSHNHAFYECQAWGTAGGRHAVYGASSYFRWRGGWGGYHGSLDAAKCPPPVPGALYCDFMIADQGTLVDIDGWNSEHSQALLHTGGPGNGPCPTRLTNCRFDTNSLRDDGRLVQFQAAGPFVMESNFVHILSRLGSPDGTPSIPPSVGGWLADDYAPGGTPAYGGRPLFRHCGNGYYLDNFGRRGLPLPANAVAASPGYLVEDYGNIYRRWNDT